MMIMFSIAGTACSSRKPLASSAARRGRSSHYMMGVANAAPARSHMPRAGEPQGTMYINH